MTKFFIHITIFFLVGMFTGCSQVLQTVDLSINSEDSSLQEEFNVVERTLTIKQAKAQKTAPYQRVVIKSGRGKNAQPIPEKFVLKSEFPKINSPIEYEIGIGDTIAFSRLLENNQSNGQTENQWPVSSRASNYKLGIGDALALTLIKTTKANQQLAPSGQDQNVIVTQQQIDETINSTGRIGSDGSVLLLEVGRLEATGKSLSELRSEVRNIFIRNGTSPRFQLEITDFRSQRAYLTVSSTQGTASQIINLNDQRTTLLDILTSSRISYKPGVITIVKLRRENDIFYMRLRDIFTTGSPQIHILDRDHIFVEENSAQMVTSLSKVDKDGNVVLTGVGKIKVLGRSLNELQNEIEKLLEKVPSSQNAFQIQIQEFLSQSASAILPIKEYGSQDSFRIPITDNPITLAEVITDNGLRIEADKIVQINLQRNGANYVFTLDHLLDPKNSDLYLQPGDHVSVEIFPYKENKVFILGGVSPQIFKINPANRETLADVLFTSGGPLSESSAKRSEIYLLRGNNPITAYHLDAQSPTRLIVADAMELRPNDILYVAEQPIMSFNRTLATIVPLRILLRDIKDDRIP